MKTISVVSPCYMEEANVENCYRTVKAIFEEHLPEYRLEHIFVDNCSTDETVNILRELAQNDTGVKVVVNSRNFGSYRSAFNGLKFATGDAIVVLLPVDLQDPPELIPEFVKHWENGIEVVAGSRGEREEGFFLRNARRVFYRIVNGLSAFEIPSDVGEFQLVDRKVLDAMLRYNDHYPYIRGIIASCGFKRLIIPYVWVTRKRGISSSNLPIMIDQALNGIFSFTNVPMRLCTLVGFAISILCVVFSLFVMASYFFAPDLIPRGTTTIIVAVVLLSGIQLIFTGMLGEYVTSIHQQVRGGPLVIERETINIEPAINAPQNSGPVG
ncbi:MAG: glycosyltransferase family 2 protein [Hyphomonas sp.]|nr:glycosyltransferase family 2 protein [Henriciella sp.]MBO6696608.1 glycosyltransferase family 2 protein [Henriciella sp.]MCR9223380.1 glycosyltransferase family 2 protein [Hyphomonas sp.]